MNEGRTTDTRSYRPISFIPTFLKSFELILLHISLIWKAIGDLLSCVLTENVIGCQIEILCRLTGWQPTFEDLSSGSAAWHRGIIDKRPLCCCPSEDLCLSRDHLGEWLVFITCDSRIKPTTDSSPGVSQIMGPKERLILVLLFIFPKL